MAQSSVPQLGWGEIMDNPPAKSSVGWEGGIRGCEQILEGKGMATLSISHATYQPALNKSGPLPMVPATTSPYKSTSVGMTLSTLPFTCRWANHDLTITCSH